MGGVVLKYKNHELYLQAMKVKMSIPNHNVPDHGLTS